MLSGESSLVYSISTPLPPPALPIWQVDIAAAVAPRVRRVHFILKAFSELHVLVSLIVITFATLYLLNKGALAHLYIPLGAGLFIALVGATGVTGASTYRRRLIVVHSVFVLVCFIGVAPLLILTGIYASDLDHRGCFRQCGGTRPTIATPTTTIAATTEDTPTLLAAAVGNDVATMQDYLNLAGSSCWFVCSGDPGWNSIPNKQCYALDISLAVFGGIEALLCLLSFVFVIAALFAVDTTSKEYICEYTSACNDGGWRAAGTLQKPVVVEMKRDVMEQQMTCRRLNSASYTNDAFKY